MTTAAHRHRSLPRTVLGALTGPGGRVVPRATLTPDLLTVAALGPVELVTRYGYSLIEGQGCGGSERVGQLLSEQPRTYEQVGQARTRVDQAVRDARAAVAAHVGAHVGPAPVFDDRFTGTRRKFEKAYADWKSAREQAELHQGTPDLVALWAREGFTCVEVSQVVESNSEYFDADDDASQVRFLGHGVEHGCRCAHGGLSLTTPDHAEDAHEVASVQPQRVALVTAGPWTWVAQPHLLDQEDPAQAAGELLGTVARSWTQVASNAASREADLASKVASLPTPEQLLDMGPVEYQAAQEQLRNKHAWTYRLKTARAETAADHLNTAAEQLGVTPVRVQRGHVEGEVAAAPRHRTPAHRWCGTPADGARGSA